MWWILNIYIFCEIIRIEDFRNPKNRFQDSPECLKLHNTWKYWLILHTVEASNLNLTTVHLPSVLLCSLVHPLMHLTTTLLRPWYASSIIPPLLMNIAHNCNIVYPLTLTSCTCKTCLQPTLLSFYIIIFAMSLIMFLGRSNPHQPTTTVINHGLTQSAEWKRGMSWLSWKIIPNPSLPEPFRGIWSSCSSVRKELMKSWGGCIYAKWPKLTSQDFGNDIVRKRKPRTTLGGRHSDRALPRCWGHLPHHLIRSFLPLPVTWMVALWVKTFNCVKLLMPKKGWNGEKQHG